MLLYDWETRSNIERGSKWAIIMTVYTKHDSEAVYLYINSGRRYVCHVPSTSDCPLAETPKVGR